MSWFSQTLEGESLLLFRPTIYRRYGISIRCLPRLPLTVRVAEFLIFSLVSALHVRGDVTHRALSLSLFRMLSRSCIVTSEYRFGGFFPLSPPPQCHAPDFFFSFGSEYYPLESLSLGVLHCITQAFLARKDYSKRAEIGCFDLLPKVYGPEIFFRCRTCFFPFPFLDVFFNVFQLVLDFLTHSMGTYTGFLSPSPARS